MTKLLIIDHYSANKGDVAILNTMIHTLRTNIRGVEISVSSSNPAITAEQIRVKALRWVIDKPRVSWSKMSVFQKLVLVTQYSLYVLQSLIWAIFKRYWNKNLNLFINAEKEELLQEYANADVVISQGGGHLNSRRGSYLKFYAIFLAIVLGKRTMIYAQSIGPFDNKLITRIYKLMLRFTLNRVDIITLREYISEKTLHNLGVHKPPIYVTSDSAILLRPAKSGRIKEILYKEDIPNKEEKRLLVGISLLHWGYPGSSNPSAAHEKYKKVMAQIADYLIGRLNATVVFVPMEDEERLLALETLHMMSYKRSAKVIMGDYTPEELKGIIGEMDLLIGTHIHTLIFAVTADEPVPVICIMYEHPKAKGIMALLGQEKFIVNIENIDVEELITKIKEVCSAKDQIKESLRHKVKILQERSLLNVKFVAKLLELDW